MRSHEGCGWVCVDSRTYAFVRDGHERVHGERIREHCVCVYVLVCVCVYVHVCVYVYVSVCDVLMYAYVYAC